MNESVGAELLKNILHSPRLPSLPAVALEVLDLAQRPDVGIDSLARTIGRDPALASKVLRTANSSFYAQHRAVTTLPQAVMLLGLNSVRSLALGFSLVDSLRRSEGRGFDYGRFWQHSLYSAVGARALAARARVVEPEEAFLGGLLHGIGVLAMNEVLGSRYEAMMAQRDEARRLEEAEQTAFGLTHTLVGEALSEQWHLPPQLSACIRWYREPEEAEVSVLPLVRTVSAGVDIADLLTDRRAAVALQRYRERSAPWFGLTDAAAEQVVHTAQEACASMAQLFDLAPAPESDVATVLLRANEALLELSLQSAEETIRAERQNRNLALDATTDALTGIANRRRFDQFLDEQVRAAIDQDQPLSLLFLDLDHFKRLNDTHGHVAGDRMLTQVAAALRSEVRVADLLARYGGEEFCVVMPNAGAAAATAAAERLRQAVEQVTVNQVDGNPIGTTVSVGVVTFVHDRHESAVELLADADAALYVAKRAGRNQVSVGAGRRAA
ncbi:MAG: GGDEF domain-containing protein [Dehalococcoidia bacterium]